MSDEPTKSNAPESPEADSSKEPCAHCGRVHKDPHSKGLLSLFEDWKKASDPETRIELMETMALLFVTDVDPSDCSLSEKAHHLVDEFRTAHLAYQRAAMNLARLLVNSMQTEERLAAFKESMFATRPPATSPEGAGNVN